jgi:surface protein
MTFASTDGNPTIATLPLVVGGNYGFTVDWGDGSSNTISSWNDVNKTHTYGNSDRYYIIVSGTIRGFSYDEAATPQVQRDQLREITEFGPLAIGAAGQTDNYTFAGCVNLEIISAPTGPSLLYSTSLVGMFSGCALLRDITNTNTWNLTNVTSLESTFEGCAAFAPGSLQWNTTNIISMSKMFLNCTSFNTDISQFITSGVTNMSSMFEGASLYNARVDSWNVSNVLDMTNMFNGAINYNQPLYSWERIAGSDISTLSNVTNMSGMFYGAFDFNQDISNWDITSVEDLTNFMAYKDATNYSRDYYDALLNGWSSLLLKNSVIADFGSINYTSTGEVGRDILTDTYFWSITDGGIV